MELLDPALRENLRRELAEIGAAHELRWIEDHLLTLPVVDRAARAHDILRRRQTHEPLAYILGQWAFREFEFAVGPGALIPRPETEELVEHALRLVTPTEGPFRVVDLGAGTGCVGLSFAAEWKRRDPRRAVIVDLVESSPEARVWLQKNLARFASTFPALRAAVVASPWADYPGPCDLILSNPPYIAAHEFAELDPGVRNFEPRAALVAPPIDAAGEESKFDRGIAAYLDILARAPRWLTPNGALGFELGLGQHDAVAAAARQNGFARVLVLNDMTARPRFLFAFRKE